MRVLLIFTQTVCGTIEAYEMVLGLLENGVEVSVVLSNKVDNKDDWLKIKCRLQNMYFIDTHSNKFNLFQKTIKFFLHRKKLIHDINGSSYDFIIDTMVNYWDYFIYSNVNTGKKAIIVHDPIAHSGASVLKQKIWEFQYKKADKLIVHTKKFIQVVNKLYGKSFDNIHYIPLIVHRKKINNIESSEMKLTYLSRINFLFFGYISKYKGIEILGKAFKLLEEKGYQDISLTVAGQGDFSEYNKIYSELKRVNIINRRITEDEVNCLYSIKNVVNVAPYLDATQSGVIATALDFCVPIIATDVGGLREQLDDGNIGVLCNCSVQDLANKMELFVKDKNLHSIETNKIKKYIHNISRDNVCKKLIQELTQNVD